MFRFKSRLAPAHVRNAAHALAQAIAAHGVRKIDARWFLHSRGRWVRCSFEAWCKAEGETIEVDGEAVPITLVIFNKAMHEIYRGRYGPGDAPSR